MPHHSGAELPGAQALRQMAAQSDSRGLFSDRAPDPAHARPVFNRPPPSLRNTFTNLKFL